MDFHLIFSKPSIEDSDPYNDQKRLPSYNLRKSESSHSMDWDTILESARQEALAPDQVPLVFIITYSALDFTVAHVKKLITVPHVPHQSTHYTTSKQTLYHLKAHIVSPQAHIIPTKTAHSTPKTAHSTSSNRT